MTRTGIWLWSRKMKELGSLQNSSRFRRCEKASGRIGANGDESGGGLVKVILSGNQEPRRVEISRMFWEKEQVLSDLVTAAMKDA